ncbi:hypothetical protein GGI06_003149 [Coemansia sp. S85]|nr:hypothetical protein GGI06_003149 [Coemansia sp. S85]
MNSTFSLKRKLPGHASSTQQASRKRARVGNGPTPKDASRYYHPHSTRVNKGSSSRHHKLHSSQANKTRSSRSYKYGSSYGRKVDASSAVKNNSSSAVNGDTEPGEIIETEPVPAQVPEPIPEPVPTTESEPLYVSELDGIPPEPGYPPYEQDDDNEPLFELPMGSSNETPADAPFATGTEANNEPTQARPPSSGDDKELDPTNKSGTKRKRDSESDALPVSKKGKERESPENAGATVRARHRGCRGGKQAASRKISHSAGPSNGAARSECSTNRDARSISSTKAKDPFVDTSAALYYRGVVDFYGLDYEGDMCSEGTLRCVLTGSFEVPDMVFYYSYQRNRSN